MDSPHMIRLFVGLSLAVFASFSHAAAVVPLTVPTGVAVSGGGYVTTASQAFSGASFNAGLTTQVAGRAVTVPASWRLAANAPKIAAAAVRLNPGALVTAAVATWLLTKGIEYIDGKWQQSTSIPSPEWTYNCYLGDGSPLSMGTGTCLQAIGAASPGYSYMYETYETTGLGGITRYWYQAGGIGPLQRGYLETKANICPAGTTRNGSQCVGYAEPSPAAWDAVSNLTDAAARELSKNGVPLPLQAPEWNPVTVPTSDPYRLPDGTWKRDTATLSPRSGTPPTAHVEPGEQDLTPKTDTPQVTNPDDWEPAKDPDTGAEKPPEETSDFCKENPDALACWKAGEVEEQELEKKDMPVSITPENFGPDGGSCPADETTTLANGYQVHFSYEPVCRAATTFRPVIIAVSWITAIGLMFGISRRFNG